MTDDAKPDNGRDPETGQFIVGHTGIGGRPKGSRNKLGEAYIADMYERWQARGVEAINKTIDTQPAQFIRAIASILPQQLEIKNNAFDGISDDQLAVLIAAARAIVGVHTDDGSGAEATTH